MTTTINAAQRTWTEATHVITVEHPRPSYRRESIEVRAESENGPAYTETEWEGCESADWELVGGELHWQGQPAGNYAVGGTVVLRRYEAMR